MKTATVSTLMESFGIETEYMLVDRNSLAVSPTTMQLLCKESAKSCSGDVMRNAMTWSNEVAAHVLELKVSKPVSSFDTLADAFAVETSEINRRLAERNVCLMGSGCHPWMNPATDMVLWPYENSEVYKTYDRLFSVRQHGFANVQSVHLNIGFADDAEFGRLHAAVRAVLPLIPALAAASPIADGKVTGTLDSRLLFYAQNQKSFPEIAGDIIPEPLWTEAEYDRAVFAPLRTLIALNYAQDVLRPEFVNSRGAIARFDRTAIEIRLIDAQECPRADIAISALVAGVVGLLCEEQWASLEQLKALPTDVLIDQLWLMASAAEHHTVLQEELLSVFGLSGPQTAVAIWQHLYAHVAKRIPQELHAPIECILEHGTLASRMLRHLPSGYETGAVRELYTELIQCMAHNTLLP